MKKMTLSLVLMFILAVSGCITGSKTVKPLEEKNITESPIAVFNNSADLAIQPVLLREEESYSVSEPNPAIVKIQYSQVANLISEFIDMKKKNTVLGENNYLGISENKLTIFEVKGNRDDIKEASMKLVYPKGIDKITAELNNAMMSRFLKNAAPELQDWHSRIKEILDRFYSMKTGIEGTAEENIELSNKIIQILYNKNADYITVTLRAQP